MRCNKTFVSYFDDTKICFLTVVLPMRTKTSNFVSIFDMKRNRFLCMDFNGELFNSVSNFQNMNEVNLKGNSTKFKRSYILWLYTKAGEWVFVNRNIPPPSQIQKPEIEAIMNILCHQDVKSRAALEFEWETDFVDQKTR